MGKILPTTFPHLRMYQSLLLIRNGWLLQGKPSICRKDFERLNLTIRDKNGKPYEEYPQPGWAGSVRSLGPANCRGRGVAFLPFNVLEGLDEGENSNCREERLYQLSKLRFVPCPCCGTRTEPLRKQQKRDGSLRPYTAAIHPVKASS